MRKILLLNLFSLFCLWGALSAQDHRSLATQNSQHGKISTSAQSSDMVMDTTIWSKIELSSARMKPKSSKFPIWIPATVIPITAIAYVFLSDRDTGSSFPTAQDDSYTILCGRLTTVFPLINDTGEEIRIVSVTSSTGDLPSFTEMSIDLSGDFPSDYLLTYTIEDANGNRATATIQVVIVGADLSVPDQNFEMTAGQSIEGVFFNPSTCDGCKVVGVTNTMNGYVAWSVEGNFTITLPLDAPVPSAEVFEVTVVNRCQMSTTALLTINISAPCDIAIEASIHPEECKLSDGGITIQIENAQDFSFIWDNGENTLSIQNLSRGQYVLTVISLSNPSCTSTFTFEVPGEDYPIMAEDDVYHLSLMESVVANVFENDLGTGLELVSFIPITEAEIFTIDILGNMTFKPSNEQLGEFNSVYVVQDACMSTSMATISFLIKKEDCDISFDIETTPTDCGKANGVASVINLIPEGDYLIEWSNGETGFQAVNLANVDHSITISDPSLNCSTVMDFTIEENPPQDIVLITDSGPASCLGGGVIGVEMILELDKSAQLRIYFEGVQLLDLDLMAGNYVLNDEYNFLPGMYTIVARELGLPERCAQIFDFEIEEVDLPMVLNEDIYTTTPDVPVSGNVLTNDLGTGLSIIDFVVPSSGVLTLSSEGDFTYIPDSDFFGTIEVLYRAIDTCGQEGDALLIIVIEAGLCDYTVSFSVLRPNCGMQNGEATATLFPPDMLVLSWSNGQTGNTISDVGEGTYSLLVFNPDTQCEQSFSLNIIELDPEYIINITTSSPTCNNDAQVIIELVSPGTYTLEIIAPNGNNFILNLPGGTHMLSDMIEIIPGDWVVIVNELNAQPYCLDVGSFVIELYEPIIIEVVSTSAPSTPDSNDGVIVLQISGSNPPFLIFANELVFGPFQEGEHSLTGLYAGLWEIIAIDLSEECFSNFLLVPLFPDEGFNSFRVNLNFLGQSYFSLYTDLYKNLSIESIKEMPNSFLPIALPTGMVGEIFVNPKSSWVMGVGALGGSIYLGAESFDMNAVNLDISHRRHHQKKNINLFYSGGLHLGHWSLKAYTTNSLHLEKMFAGLSIGGGVQINISTQLSFLHTNRCVIDLATSSPTLGGTMGLFLHFNR
jgi:hypothetical protein